MQSPALELANARLDSPAALLSFLERAGLGAAVDVSDVGLRLSEFEGLRSGIRELLDASVGGGPLPAAAVGRLNEASARIPRVLLLDAGGTALEEELGVGRNAGARILAEIARSGIVLVALHRDRIRRCPACGDFFVSTRASRTWCSSACGNRTRVARHHARARARSSGPS